VQSYLRRLKYFCWVTSILYSCQRYASEFVLLFAFMPVNGLTHNYIFSLSYKRVYQQ